MRPYIPLHNHTHYSLLDGLSKPEQIAKRCIDIQSPSCAITDHGTISGCVNFYQTMKKSNIKPILGCELYICRDDVKIQNKSNQQLSHMLVLSKNYTGWRNLIKIVSECNRPEHFYRKPRIDLHSLSNIDTDGLICLTGHMGSTLADIIMEENMAMGSKHIDHLISIFGRDNLFLESQLMDQKNNPEQIVLVDKIRNLAQKSKVRVVATCDAHYANKEDAIDQRVLLCNNLKTTFTDINKKILNEEKVPLDSFFKSEQFYILSGKEMSEIHTEQEIANTCLIDDMCENYDILDKPSLPKFIDEEDEYLRQLCRDGWKDKNLNSLTETEKDIYVNRIKKELEVLQGAGLSGYFLIVQDIVRHVKSQNWLPGPGRGSAAGCLVSYLIGITNIDPIKYDLLFERFYNAGRNSGDRISMPDIDIDVPMTKRDEIIQYIKTKYGHNKVSQMITYNTMKGRGALKEVLRVYGGISFDEMNAITKNIPDEAKISDELQEMKEDRGESSIITWALENNPDKFKDWVVLDKNNNMTGLFAKRFEQAIRLEGTKCNQSKHAAGIAISANTLDHICPMVYDTKTHTTIAGMEMQDLESIGIVKFDILGIGMLDKIMCVQSLLMENNYG